jgi:universal stress protein E
MEPIRRILFAVKDPAARRQPGIDKAIRIAKSFGASLELFHALASPVFQEVQPLVGSTLEELRRHAQEQAQLQLEGFFAPARKSGVALSCAAEWDYPPHEAVVRRAQRIGADLIIAECHKGTRLGAWLIHLTDWELLRNSPLPVLLLRSGRPYRRSVTLAAIDPTHQHAKPLDLDARILDAARQFSVATRGSMHVMHANHPSVFGMALGDPALDGATLALNYDELRIQDAKEFETFLATWNIPRPRRHLVDGEPAAAIVRTARRLGAGVVVMGAISRSGLKRLFIGNTAERVLSALTCDVLVVKPLGFAKRVDVQPRGMRVITAPSVMHMAS